MRPVITAAIVTLFIGCAVTTSPVKLFDEGNFDQALALSRSNFQKDSTNVAALIMMGKCYLAKSILDSAELSFNKAMQKFENNQELKAELIKIKKALIQNYRVSGDEKQSLSKFKEILQLDAADVDALEGIGDIYLKNGFYDKAKMQFIAAFALDSSRVSIQNKIAMISLAADSTDAIVARGFEALDNYQYNQADQLFARALQIKPDDVDSKYGKHLAAGLILYKKGGQKDLWDAIEQFGLAATLKPKLAEPHFYMAMSYEKKDREEFENAIFEYETALQLEPDGKFSEICRKKSKELRTLQRKLLEFWGK